MMHGCPDCAPHDYCERHREPLPSVEEIAVFVEHLRDDYISECEHVGKVARLIRERFNTRNPKDTSSSEVEPQPGSETLQSGPVDRWESAALIIGEHLATVGPNGYYNFTPDEWVTWARSALTAQAAEIEHLRARLASSREP